MPGDLVGNSGCVGGLQEQVGGRRDEVVAVGAEGADVLRYL